MCGGLTRKGTKMGKNNNKLEVTSRANRDNKILNQTKSQGGGKKFLHVCGEQPKRKGLHKLLGRV